MLLLLALGRRQFRIATYDEQSGLDPAPFADLFGESDDLFDVSSIARLLEPQSQMASARIVPTLLG